MSANILWVAHNPESIGIGNCTTNIGGRVIYQIDDEAVESKP